MSAFQCEICVASGAVPDGSRDWIEEHADGSHTHHFEAFSPEPMVTAECEPDLTYAQALRQLRGLAVGSVVLDSDGDAWQLTPSGWTCVGFDGTNARDMDASSVAILTPITVIYRASDVEADS